MNQKKECMDVHEAMFELIQPTAIGWAPDVGHIDYDYGTWSTGR